MFLTVQHEQTDFYLDHSLSSKVTLAQNSNIIISSTWYFFPIQTVYTLESDCILKQVQQHGFTEMVITREVIDDVMTTSVRTGDSSATLKYRRIGPPKRQTGTKNLGGPLLIPPPIPRER
ncbi:hypothetical protein AHF37_10294 [Paragonimus kellicotti]|nr:hypothetical protein AHF37_10294 [Paragonimus kellicotti]